MSYQDLLNKMVTLKEDEEFLNKIRDWAVLHGIGMRPRIDFNENSLVVAPFVLFPSPIEKSSFDKAIKVQEVLNSLFHRLAYDPEFLTTALANSIEHDDFTRRLFQIYEQVKEKNYSQRYSLGLLRSDYLPDFDGALKQVEFNTIASSMSGLIDQVGRCHRFVLQDLGMQSHLKNLPENNALSTLCEGLIEAWKLYSSQRSKKSVIVFVIEEVTYNIADQRFMEFDISRQNPDVKVIRRKFSELLQEGKLGPSNEFLVGDHEVAVLYFRTGYVPNQFYNDSCWDLRLTIEKSIAIKCPSIQYQLVGTKKVQQVLSEPGVLEKYLGDEESVRLVREMFVDMYPLDQSEEGERGYRLAMSQPDSFVLKPQREGGGHNIYGTDIPEYLKGLRREEASAYILMRLIQTKPTPNIIIRQTGAALLDTISELGVYGIVLGNGGEILLNRSGGHMLRTKEEASREVGVAAGFGALDSPYLI